MERQKREHHERQEVTWMNFSPIFHPTNVIQHGRMLGKHSPSFRLVNELDSTHVQILLCKTIHNISIVNSGRKNIKISYSLEMLRKRKARWKKAQGRERERKKKIIVKSQKDTCSSRSTQLLRTNEWKKKRKEKNDKIPTSWEDPHKNGRNW